VEELVWKDQERFKSASMNDFNIISLSRFHGSTGELMTYGSLETCMGEGD
jgi:hypothetical protein